MSAILRRAERTTLLFAVALLGLSLLSPLVTLAQVSFTAGDTAVISAGGGSVNVRADADPNAESLGQVPDGTEVYIVDGPFSAADGSLWYQAGVWDLVGYINASMLGSVSSSSGETTESQAPTSSSIPWKQPIDYGVVVDNSASPLPGDGLACRVDASSSASTITRMWVGQSVEVVGQSIWSEGIEFLPVNCDGVGGFVKADYVALQSQQVAATEEVVVTEEVVEEVVQEETVDPNAPVAGDLVVTVLDQNGAAVPGACFTLYLGGEWVAESCDSNDAIPNNGNSGFFGIPAGTYTLVSTTFEANNQEVWIGAGDTAYATVYTSVEAPADEDVATEEVATDEAVTEEVVTEEVATEEVVTEEVVTEETATEEVVTEAPVTEEATDEVTEEATDEATETEDAATEEVTEETVTEEVATEAPGSTLGEPIGDATVTDTNGASLTCRVAPDATSAVITSLPEGTTVFVYAEAVNGYLAIGCGDQLGYADVNYLWAGGAGDEIPSSASSVIVVGTGGLSLNCRAGAGTSYGVIATVAQGTVLTSRGASSNGWAPVVCNGLNGFVSISYVETTGQSSGNNGGSNNNGGSGGQSGTVTVTGTGSSLRCRTGANTGASIITSLPDGTVLTTRGSASNGWLPVVCAGQNGFVSTDYTTSNGGGSGTTTPTPTATTTPGGGSTGAYVKVTGTGGSSLNCRSAGSLSGMVITSIPFGSTVATRGAVSNGWLPVTCGGKAGYVSAEYVTATTDPGNGGGNGNQTPTPDPGNGGGSTGTAVVNAGGDNLRCRTAASSTAAVITSVPHGTTVTTRGASSNGWTPVVCGGQNGFMASEFLSTSGGGSGTTPTPTQTPPPSNGSGMTTGDHGKVNARANMRYQASMSANVMTTVDAGEVLLITGPATNSFYPVDYDGLKAFMHVDLLNKTTEPLSKRGGSGNDPDPTTPSPGGGSATGSALVNYAMRYIGYPYVPAGRGPSSFDCSGFTYWVTKNVMGKDIGSGLWTQTVAGTAVSRSSLQPGDLVFFQNTYKAGLSHVGIYIGNDQFVHAENENTGVRVSDLNSTYYSSRWYGAVRLG